MKRILIPLIAVLLSACSRLQPPPRFTLATPAAFGETGRRTIHRGESLSEMFPGEFRAKEATTVIYGRWVNPAFVDYPSRGTYYGREKHRPWSIELHQGASAQVAKAFQAKDGYEAALGEEIDASARIYPRFRHKHFSWGEAVSFLVQYQNDNTDYVPNNGMLSYEVHGLTNDGKYTVRAQFGLTHPRLKEFGPQVRDHRSITAGPDPVMLKDPDYVLVERCPDEAFQPSIKEIDALVDTLRPNVAR